MSGDCPTYRYVMLPIEREPDCRDMGVTSQSGSKTDPIVEANLAKLSAGQLDCLLLVDQHLSSKEIAVRLGISPHTVDQRIRQALQILGVGKRQHAARLVAAHHAPYQRLIHQTPYIVGHAAAGHSEGAVGFQIRHADRAGEAGDLGIETEQMPRISGSSLPLPFATRSQPRNEMSTGLRLVWIFLIAIGAMFSAGMYLAGLESLMRMLGR